MLNSTVTLKTYDHLPVDKNEVLHFAGVKVADEQMDSLLKESINEALPLLSYKVCFKTFDINNYNKKLDLGFCTTDSMALIKNLKNCKKIILFAATIGLNLDRLISRYGKIHPAKAVVLQALGAERIEALCNAFCLDIESSDELKDMSLVPRFSPGYGDFPLTIQKDIFEALNPSKYIGLSLNDSMLMSPSKSVTAIIGITKK